MTVVKLVPFLYWYVWVGITHLGSPEVYIKNHSQVSISKDRRRCVRKMFIATLFTLKKNWKWSKFLTIRKLRYFHCVNRFWAITNCLLWTCLLVNRSAHFCIYKRNCWVPGYVYILERSMYSSCFHLTILVCVLATLCCFAGISLMGNATVSFSYVY